MDHPDHRIRGPVVRPGGYQSRTDAQGAASRGGTQPANPIEGGTVGTAKSPTVLVWGAEGPVSFPRSREIFESRFNYHRESAALLVAARIRREWGPRWSPRRSETPEDVIGPGGSLPVLRTRVGGPSRRDPHRRSIGSQPVSLPVLLPVLLTRRCRSSSVAARRTGPSRARRAMTRRCDRLTATERDGR
jgi:hypothetical protein